MLSSQRYARTVPLLIAFAVLPPGATGVPRETGRQAVAASSVVGGQTLDVDLVRGNLIVVRGAIDGVGVSLVVDTGTSRTVIDSRLTGDVQGTPDRMYVFGQMVPARRTTLPSLQLGPLHVARLEILAADLSGVRQRLETPLDGIVGLDILRGQCVIVDYAARSLSFNCETAWTASLVCAADSPYLVALTRIDRREYRLLVDSGSDAIAIFERSVDPHVADRHAGEVTADTVLGTVRLRRFLASVRLGAVPLGFQPVYVIPSGGPGKSPGFDGVLGLRCIAPRVQLDLERMTISWNP